MNGKLAEANGLMAEADKAASSGFFKKPDWAKAAATYAKAAVAFKVAKERAACVAAHKRASECFLQSEGGLFHAAKHLESAARESDSAVVRKELLQKAAAISRENGGHDKAASLLGEAAKAAEEAHLMDDAASLYREAADICEDEGKTDSRLLEALLSVLVRSGNFRGATKQSEQCCEMWIKKNNLPEAYRTVNCQIILHLHLGDRVAAERCYSVALADVPGYMESDAGAYANELLEAIKNQNAEALAALKQSSKFRYLESSIVKLFREFKVDAAIPVGEEDLT